MRTVAGIFASRKAAERAFTELEAGGFRGKNVTLLTPENHAAQIESIPSEDAEQPGMGKAIGAVVGGAAGLATGAVAGSLLLPGVGTILAVGLGAGLFGAGGAVAGAAGGGALERNLSDGVPKDEVFFYEDALRQGRSLVVAETTDDAENKHAYAIMEKNQAESINAARDQWWIGLRDAEEAVYDSPLGEFKLKEGVYRRGFEAALEPEYRGKPLPEARPKLRERFPSVCDDDAFCRGYVRGQEYYSRIQNGVKNTGSART